jgi:hypothetical protein
MVHVVHLVKVMKVFSVPQLLQLVQDRYPQARFRPVDLSTVWIVFPDLSWCSKEEAFFCHLQVNGLIAGWIHQVYGDWSEEVQQ